MGSFRAVSKLLKLLVAEAGFTDYTLHNCCVVTGSHLQVCRLSQLGLGWELPQVPLGSLKEF